MMADSRWRWHKSTWWGWMWGPIPVAFMLLVVGLAGAFFYFYVVAE
ncbi:hypothetical protein ENSA7_48270 [Enhygromyxa salina]|uniref:Uncharacterized protein n=1 Tax=Enhygromyxa salina TaxID=215803 RepID=A0A2S9YIW4_9BACT|nr:hypothetical protein ENSA7_48270 [Enhygromyxa salina]